MPASTTWPGIPFPPARSTSRSGHTPAREEGPAQNDDPHHEELPDDPLFNLQGPVDGPGLRARAGGQGAQAAVAGLHAHHVPAGPLDRSADRPVVQLPAVVGDDDVVAVPLRLLV